MDALAAEVETDASPADVARFHPVKRPAPFRACVFPVALSRNISRK